MFQCSYSHGDETRQPACIHRLETGFWSFPYKVFQRFNYIPCQTSQYLHTIRSLLEETLTIVVLETNCTAWSPCFSKHWTFSVPWTVFTFQNYHLSLSPSSSFHDPWRCFLNSPVKKKRAWQLVATTLEKQTSSKKSSHVPQPVPFSVYLNNHLSFIFIPSLKRNLMLGLAIHKTKQY